jgi:hypothetical protein
MWRVRKTKATVDRDTAFEAWVQWREAAAMVRALWTDVLQAPRGTRAAAYSQYRQALSREEHAASELAMRVGGASALAA